MPPYWMYSFAVLTPEIATWACESVQFHRKGHTVCANNAQVLMSDADWAVMEVVQDELLDPVVVRARRIPDAAWRPRSARASLRSCTRPMH